MVVVYIYNSNLLQGVTVTAVTFFLFEQKYRSHIIITCLYHNMQQTCIQLNDIYIYMMIITMIIDMMLYITIIPNSGKHR